MKMMEVEEELTVVRVVVIKDNRMAMMSKQQQTVLRGINISKGVITKRRIK